MGKLFTGNVTSLSQQVRYNKPIDDRFVVITQEDLFDTDTWKSGSSEEPYVHDGMRVSVVGGVNLQTNLPMETEANIGLYMLVDREYYDKQSWDSTAANYHARGWKRIDGSSQGGGGGTVYMDMRDDNENTYPGQFGGAGTQANPYYVKMINGGIIVNQSNY